jgi:hypothetical protein
MVEIDIELHTTEEAFEFLDSLPANQFSQAETMVSVLDLPPSVARASSTSVSGRSSVVRIE